MGHSGHDLAPPGSGQVSKNCGGNLTAYVSERIAVEEEEGGTPMTVPQECYRFV
jgi:hypothetical protein